MTQPEVVIDGQPYRLGRRIGKGGEGSVYLLGSDQKYAVKIYAANALSDKESKVLAMVRTGLASKAPLVAFPLSIVKDTNGQFVGFLMKLVSDHKPLHDLYSPGSRKQHFPQADYRFLVRAASNFARSVALTHQAGCVIGDINHSGVLVSSKATVTLIDADSFQFTERGQSYLCKVGVPEYTPPELQGKTLSGVQRNPNHDAFGMAVIIFQLLFMGRHPFVGTVRKGDIPPLHENIQNFRYVYTDLRDVGMDQPPGTPALTDFSPDLDALFEQAFSKTGAGSRPSAELWVEKLEKLEKSLIQCTKNKLHYSPAGANDCAWCEMEEQLNTILFLPHYGNINFVAENFDPDAKSFNAETIWRQVQGIARHLRTPPEPQYKLTTPTPSQAALAEKEKSKPNFAAYVLGGFSLVGLISFPKLWFLFIPLAWLFFASAKSKNSVNTQTFESAYITVTHAFNDAKSNWLKRIGYSEFSALYAQLEKAYQTYNSLSTEESSLKSKYQNERKDRQLRAFLDQFDIARQKIKGIGPAKLATLESYGIDTAADVIKAKLLAVPGFGEKNSQGLLEWRKRLESKFVYQVQINDTDRQELARITAQIQAKAIPLRKLLANGPKNLELLAKRILSVQNTPDPLVVQKAQHKEQVRIDIEFLGGRLPTVPSRPPPVAVAVPQTPPTYPNAPQSTYRPPPKQASTARCPRCGSSMQLRMAKRGRNAGSNFWGCSRYPRCKGTLNI